MIDLNRRSLARLAALLPLAGAPFPARSEPSDMMRPDDRWTMWQPDIAVHVSWSRGASGWSPRNMLVVRDSTRALAIAHGFSAQQKSALGAWLGDGEPPSMLDLHPAACTLGQGCASRIGDRAVRRTLSGGTLIVEHEAGPILFGAPVPGLSPALLVPPAGEVRRASTP